MLILDLDGTILSVNSFRRWALYLVSARFPHLGAPGRIRVGAAVLKALAERKLRFTDHEVLKWRLQKLWQIATQGDEGVSERALVADLMNFVRPELAPVLKAIAGGEIEAVMATAAVGDYAYALGRSLGFTHILATHPMRAVDDPSNVGQHKRKAVEEFLAGRGLQGRPLTVFTDHVDDLPLIRICQTVYWFGSDRERIAIEQCQPGIQICRGLCGGYEIDTRGLAIQNIG